MLPELEITGICVECQRQFVYIKGHGRPRKFCERCAGIRSIKRLQDVPKGKEDKPKTLIADEEESQFAWDEPSIIL